MNEYEDRYEYWRFEGPTSRLARNGFEWGMPPRSQKGRDKWEREADRILGEAHAQLGKDGAVWDAQGNRVWSLDQYQDMHGDVLAQDFGWDSITAGDLADQTVAEAALVASLTPSETEVVSALAEGTSSGVYGWTEPLAARFGWTPGAVRKHWSTARKKLRNCWALEPDPWVRTPLRSCQEGNGHTLFIGQPRSWGRIVTAEDKAEALTLHRTSPIKDHDWRYERSLTDDGWQLWDDNLWSDWSPRWLA